MSYLEQLQIKKAPVKNSDFVIHLIDNSESKKKEKEERKRAKEEAKVYNEDGELEADFDEDQDKEVEDDTNNKTDVEPPSVIPFFVDKTKETTLNRDLILAKIKKGIVHTEEKHDEEKKEDDEEKEEEEKEEEIVEIIETAPNSDKVIKTKTKVTIKKQKAKDEETKDAEEAPEDETPKEITVKKRGRRAKPKTVSLMKIDDIIINEKSIKERLPTLKEKYIHKASSYYMNNRKLFVEKINQLLTPYIKELEESGHKDKKDYELFTHQKIVRDYLNNHTPYRGLLLLHGLGSGKTCTSIAIAEGMKSDKKVYILTPASLKSNFFSELKKCGDPLFRKNQFWEFVSNDGKPNMVDVLSSALGLPKEFIRSQNGAWLVDASKPSNFGELDSQQQKQIDEQLNEMIRVKYIDYNYNGLTTRIFNEMTENETYNPFDHSVVIVDEAHNLVSRIINKIKSTDNFAQKIYELLLSATNVKIVLLTGTPIINYPNEIGVLYNILRGYIKTWTFPIVVKTSGKVNKETIMELFEKANFRTFDYMEYSGNKLTITRNPFGFINVKKRGKQSENIEQNYNGVKLDDTGNISDEDFVKTVLAILNKNGLEVNDKQVQLTNNKCLPDLSDDFIGTFIDSDSMVLKNENVLKRRILGLSSYFKSAEEGLLPSFVMNDDKIFHIVACEMSDYQFGLYEKIRKEEADKEKIARRRRKKGNTDELYQIASSYRIFSRACCNFAFPKPPGRPMITKETDEKDETDKKDDDENDLDDYDDVEYKEKIQRALSYLKDHAKDFLLPEYLEIYSPKYCEILDNLKNRDYIGLHLLYSQFRTLEGIGIFKLVLDANGFSQFRISKVGSSYELHEENDYTKPNYFLYTGTEEAEEKEVLLNIYNSNWDVVPVSIREELRKKYENNFFGEVIKIMMITSSGAEGINLKNTRFVHIMEPYWNMVRLEQVIGRARRINSHMDLSEEYRNVQVFLYMTTLSEEQSTNEDNVELRRRDVSKLDKKTPLTTDEYLFEISNVKHGINKQILNVITETSMDCSLHSKDVSCFNYGKVSSNMFGSYPTLFEDSQQKEATKQVKLKLKKVSIDGVAYAVDISTGEAYTMQSYEKLKKHPDEKLDYVGQLVKKGSKYIIEPRKETV
jgi:hypothetical protein